MLNRKWYGKYQASGIKHNLFQELMSQTTWFHFIISRGKEQATHFCYLIPETMYTLYAVKLYLAI